MTADAPRVRFDAGRAGVGLGLALGLVLIAFASGGYFPTAWAWGALISLVVVAALLVLGTAVEPSGLALVSLGGLAGLGAWTWLALLWSDDSSATVLEGQRVLLYVAAFAALLAVVRRATVPLVLSATFTAVFLASGYGLLTRLFPERLGVFDPVAAYRLAEPLTYWNAAGVFAVMGALLAFGFATRAQSLAAARSLRSDPAAPARHGLLHLQPRRLGRRCCRPRRRGRRRSPSAAAHRRSHRARGAFGAGRPALLACRCPHANRRASVRGVGRRPPARCVPDPPRGRFGARRRALLARRAADQRLPGRCGLRSPSRSSSWRSPPSSPSSSATAGR